MIGHLFLSTIRFRLIVLALVHLFFVQMPSAFCQGSYLVDGQSVNRDFVLKLNQCTALVNAGKFEEALPLVRSLISQSSTVATAHWYYAKILYSRGAYKEAYTEAVLATELMPTNANFYITLGNAALKAEKKLECLKALKTYLSLAPNSAYAASVRQFVQAVQEEVAQDRGAALKTKSLPGTYLGEATVSGVTHWSLEKMPLKVYINPHADLEGVLKQAFWVWQTQTNELVRFQFVESKANADIVCGWIDESELKESSIEGANTRYRDGLTGRISATISIVDKRNGLAIAAPEIKSIALHEIGHALGINGHSSDPGDIMFLSVNKNITSLSERDLSTMQALYRLKPGLLNP